MTTTFLENKISRYEVLVKEAEEMVRVGEAMNIPTIEANEILADRRSTLADTKAFLAMARRDEAKQKDYTGLIAMRFDNGSCRNESFCVSATSKEQAKAKATKQMAKRFPSSVYQVVIEIY